MLNKRLYLLKMTKVWTSSHDAKKKKKFPKRCKSWLCLWISMKFSIVISNTWVYSGETGSFWLNQLWLQIRESSTLYFSWNPYWLQNIMHLHYSHTGNEIFKTFLPSLALNEKKNIRLTKICEKGRKDHIFVSFRMFPFHGNITFSELSFKM